MNKEKKTKQINTKCLSMASNGKMQCDFRTTVTTVPTFQVVTTL